MQTLNPFKTQHQNNTHQMISTQGSYSVHLNSNLNAKIPSDFFNDIRGAEFQPYQYNMVGAANSVDEIDRGRIGEKLFNFQNLEENWDGDGAKKISKEVLKRVFRLLHSTPLLRQPDISPLPSSGISIEFDLSRPYSLIIELEEITTVHSIVLRTDYGRLYFTGLISNEEEAAHLIINFFNEQLPNGKSFKRIIRESRRFSK